MTDKAKIIGNTKPKWFIKERSQAWAKLEKLYQGTHQIRMVFRLMDENIMIEQYQCYNGEGYDMVNIEVNRGVDAPFHAVYKQELLIEKEKEVPSGHR